MYTDKQLNTFVKQMSVENTHYANLKYLIGQVLTVRNTLKYLEHAKTFEVSVNIETHVNKDPTALYSHGSREFGLRETVNISSKDHLDVIVTMMEHGLVTLEADLENEIGQFKKQRMVITL